MNKQIQNPFSFSMKNTGNQDSLQNPYTLNNINQIKQIQWVGKYGKNQKKIGKWMALWNGEYLIDDFGGYNLIICKTLYYQDELKEGLWKEPNKNYQIKSPVFDIGEYSNDLRIGNWKYSYRNNTQYCWAQNLTQFFRYFQIRDHCDFIPIVISKLNSQ